MSVGTDGSGESSCDVRRSSGSKRRSLGEMVLLYEFSSGKIWVIGPNWGFAIGMCCFMACAAIGYRVAVMSVMTNKFLKLLIYSLMTTTASTYLITIISDPGIVRANKKCPRVLMNNQDTRGNRYYSSSRVVTDVNNDISSNEYGRVSDNRLYAYKHLPLPTTIAAAAAARRRPPLDSMRGEDDDGVGLGSNVPVTVRVTTDKQYLSSGDRPLSRISPKTEMQNHRLPRQLPQDTSPHDLLLQPTHQHQPLQLLSNGIEHHRSTTAAGSNTNNVNSSSTTAQQGTHNCSDTDQHILNDSSSSCGSSVLETSSNSSSSSSSGDNELSSRMTKVSVSGRSSNNVCKDSTCKIDNCSGLHDTAHNERRRPVRLYCPICEID
eukprot:Lankesteria_metandrocarpae@DN1875_c0_g1_i1.p1